MFPSIVLARFSVTDYWSVRYSTWSRINANPFRAKREKMKMISGIDIQLNEFTPRLPVRNNKISLWSVEYYVHIHTHGYGTNLNRRLLRSSWVLKLHGQVILYHLTQPMTDLFSFKLWAVATYWETASWHKTSIAYCSRSLSNAKQFKQKKRPKVLP